MELQENFKQFDQQKHPELMEGEIWVSNCSEDSYDKIGWKTKRRGEIAYDVNGKVVREFFPVFIQASEKEKEPQE